MFTFASWNLHFKKENLYRLRRVKQQASLMSSMSFFSFVRDLEMQRFPLKNYFENVRTPNSRRVKTPFPIIHIQQSSKKLIFKKTHWFIRRPHSQLLLGWRREHNKKFSTILALFKDEISSHEFLDNLSFIISGYCTAKRFENHIPRKEQNSFPRISSADRVLNIGFDKGVNVMALSGVVSVAENNFWHPQIGHTRIGRSMASSHTGCTS